MAKAKDQRAIDDCLIVFLAAANVPEIDLTVPEAGVRIWIEQNTNSITYNSDNISGSNRRPKSYTWAKEMQYIVPACQKWCRAIIANRTFVIKQSPIHNPSNDADTLRKK